MEIREINPDDFFLLNQLDWTPLPKERDSIYLILSVDQSGCSFIAEENKEFLGVLLATRSADGRSVYVNQLLVSPFARRRGVGGQLLARLEKWATGKQARPDLAPLPG
jgi:GNAT superfamily N-acetyltransferase